MVPNSLFLLETNKEEIIGDIKELHKLDQQSIKNSVEIQKIGQKKGSGIGSGLGLGGYGQGRK
jgi:hypothetical protein